MLDRTLNALIRFSTLRSVLILLAAFVLVNFVVIPAFYPRFDTLDLRDAYTPDEAYQLLDSIGPQGRAQYQAVELTLDLAYPILSAALFGSILLGCLTRLFPERRWMWWLALIPLLILLFDYLENVCVVVMLAQFPTRLDGVARAASFFTRAKLSLSAVELFTTLLAVLGLLLHRQMKPQRGKMRS